MYWLDFIDTSVITDIAYALDTLLIPWSIPPVNFLFTKNRLYSAHIMCQQHFIKSISE